MRRFAPERLIFICINEKMLSLIKYMQVGAEACGRVTNLSQNVTGERNAEGEDSYGISKTKVTASKVKRK